MREDLKLMKGKVPIVQNIIEIIGMIGMFSVLYVFFRHVHPVVPWDGDDWSTVAGFGNAHIFYGLPGLDLSDNIFGNVTGTIIGYIAAFLVYPVTKKYVLSFVIVDAFMLALTISISFVYIFRLLQQWFKEKQINCLCICFAFCSAFAIFKTTTPSTYAFWQVNQCTEYYYSIPSYLCMAYSFYMLKREVWFEPLQFNIKTAFLLFFIYFLVFSFLPAALLITTVSFDILIWKLIKSRRQKNAFRGGKLHIITVLLFAIKLFTEFHRTFDSNYFAVPTNIWDRLKTSFALMNSAFGHMNKLFLLLLIISVPGALSIYISKVRKNKDDADDAWWRLFVLSLGSLFWLYWFFVLFGVISINHIFHGNWPVRIDTLYVFYFWMIWIATLCLAYILHRCKKLLIIMPMFLFMMFSVIISPKNAYADAHFINIVPQNRYEIMDAVVDEMVRRDKLGETSLIVHMPPYGHYGGPSMAFALYVHNITSIQMDLQFKYEDGLNKWWFE